MTKRRSLHLLVPAGLLLLAACKTTGTEMAASTAGDVRKLGTEISGVQEQMTGTVTTLNALVTGGGDLQAQYKEFCKSVDGLTSQRDKVLSVRDSLAKKREQFATSWTQGLETIQNPELKERAGKRRDDVIAEFEKLKGEANETRKSFDEWYNDVTDTRSYLEFDLNEAGVKSVADKAKSIDGNAGKVSKSLDELKGKLDKLATALDAAKPPTPPEK